MLNKLKNLFAKQPEVTATETVQTEATKTETSVDAVKPVKKTRSKKSETVNNTKKTRKKKEKPQLTAKELATQNGEPYIGILSVSVDPADASNGSFELDWNDKFIVNLIKQGYRIKESDTDQDLVDRWFQTVCRNIALELYEQKMADPENRTSQVRVINQKDIGDGRTEIS